MAGGRRELGELVREERFGYCAAWEGAGGSAGWGAGADGVEGACCTGDGIAKPVLPAIAIRPSNW